MRSVKFIYRGSEYVLAVTAAALFAVYDEFGTGDVFDTTKCMEPTLEGWGACCRLAALLSEQGAAQREYLFRPPAPTLDAEQLLRTASPTDALALREAIREAFRLGFARDIPDDADEEVNLVLLEREREDAQKKNEPPGAIRARWLALAAARLRLSVRETLLLSPGEFFDMLAAVTPPRREDAPAWAEGSD